jgi:NitT/TauT family transport system substrate-binding protein
MSSGKARISIFCSLLIALVALVGASIATAQSSEPIKLNLGYSVWVGYGPWFIAQEEGYFKDNGLDVTLTDVENPADRFTAMAGGQLDGLSTTLDTLSQYCNPETPFKAILGLDESSGGDGIVANSSITSIADLKGKKIGVNLGSVSQFFLEYVFKENSLTDADVTLVRMSQGDVPAALAAGQIDAGVTWEPHLTASVKNGATLLVDSKSTPGLIVDVLVMRQDVLDARPEVAPALIDAWYKSIAYLNSDTEDAETTMAKGLGSFYETAADIAADLKGATMFDQPMNEAFWAPGAADEPAKATDTMNFALDTYTRLGVITDPCTSDKLLDASYVVPEGMVAPVMTAEATAAS